MKSDSYKGRGRSRVDRKLIFIGGSSVVRASVSQRFIEYGWHIDPFENLDELKGISIDDASIILVWADQPGAVADVERVMAERQEWHPVISCSDSVDPALIADATLAGAQSHIIWPFAIEDFERMIEISRERLDTLVRQHRAQYQASEQIDRLSARERQVLDALVRHGANKKIAAELDLSPRTVEIYRSKILQRMDVEHIAQALWVAFQSGLIDK